MLVEQLVEDGRLADLERTRLDGGVVDTKDHVDILHRLRSDIGKLLDLGSGVLNLFVAHVQVELLDSALDRVPSSQSVTVISATLGTTTSPAIAAEKSSKNSHSPDRNISGHTKVGGVEDLIGGWVGQDGLGVDTSLMGEGTGTSDVVVAVLLAPQCYT